MTSKDSGSRPLMGPMARIVILVVGIVVLVIGFGTLDNGMTCSASVVWHCNLGFAEMLFGAILLVVGLAVGVRGTPV